MRVAPCCALLCHAVLHAFGHDLLRALATGGQHAGCGILKLCLYVLPVLPAPPLPFHQRVCRVFLHLQASVDAGPAPARPRGSPVPGKERCACYSLLACVLLRGSDPCPLCQARGYGSYFGRPCRAFLPALKLPWLPGTRQEATHLLWIVSRHLAARPGCSTSLTIWSKALTRIAACRPCALLPFPLPQAVPTRR